MQLTIPIEAFHFEAELPPLWRVRRAPGPPAVPDVAAAVREQLEALGLRARIRPGMSVALTAGSRGIHDIATVLRAAVGWLQEAGAAPFIVPAMGSHGGATAAGQVELLAELGVTEAALGCPIRATMETVEIGRLPDGAPVPMDAYAAAADGILVVGRVKPHTDFHGPIESGLAKMVAIGLGKRRGAELIHRFGPDGLRERVPLAARLAVARGTVLGGLALLEDAAERTAAVVALPPGEIGGAGEAALLERARGWMGRLPFEQLDILVVDELGKNISGCGMDTNVLGRMRIPGEPDAPPHIRVVVALDMTPESHGNAAGVGLADLITARLARKIDIGATYINGLTSGLGGLQRSALPIILPTAGDAIAAALHCCARPDTGAVRVARIRNTLTTHDLLVSTALLGETAAAGYANLGPARWEGLET